VMNGFCSFYAWNAESPVRNTSTHSDDSVSQGATGANGTASAAGTRVKKVVP